MKAIIEKKETYKITSEKGDFFITENNRGKVKMFAKRDVEVVEVSELKKAKKYIHNWSNIDEAAEKRQFEQDLKIALENETGRKGLSLQDLKNIAGY
jgi:hypothetical protein